ncbi:MAG: 2'-hydroxyisoflavone reductase [Planctomycetota bacterium]|jgi:2'-hydroxyisoflavone reductase
MAANAALLTAASISSAAKVQPARDRMSFLFLGGTGFIGPHQIEYGLSRGHLITMFNRGNKAGAYDGKVEQLIGDRDSKVGAGLTSLGGDRRWDVVVDNSGYVPRHVRDSAELLKGRVGRYLFTSTVAVYDYE